MPQISPRKPNGKITIEQEGPQPARELAHLYLALLTGGTPMKRRLKYLFNISLVLAFGCGTVWAQATAQIDGTVSDPTGALLPGVEITATQTDTGITRIAVSNETGSYVLPNLALGPYRIRPA